MSKSNAFETALLNHIFNNAAIANVGDATGLPAAGTVGSLYLSLHTADPTEAGTQTSSEATYTGYARVGVVRSSAGWTISTNSVTNTAQTDFAACTGGSNTITHFGVGTLSSGAGTLLYSGSLGTSNQGPFTGTTADVITIPGHTLSVNDTVAFYAALNSSLPTGITEGTIYFVKTVAGNDITISTTQGGGTLDITVAGDGIVYKVTSLAVSTGITPSFAASAISITED